MLYCADGIHETEVPTLLKSQYPCVNPISTTNLLQSPLPYSPPFPFSIVNTASLSPCTRPPIHIAAPPSSLSSFPYTARFPSFPLSPSSSASFLAYAGSLLWRMLSRFWSFLLLSRLAFLQVNFFRRIKSGSPTHPLFPLCLDTWHLALFTHHQLVMSLESCSLVCEAYVHADQSRTIDCTFKIENVPP